MIGLSYGSNPEVDIMMPILFPPFKVGEILMAFRGISVLESMSWDYASGPLTSSYRVCHVQILLATLVSQTPKGSA